MRKMLNTLYVTTQGAYLNKEGETVVVNIERETRLRLPIHTLGSIVCFGQVSCSPFLLGHCAEHDVSVSFMTSYGKFLARVTGPAAGNVLLRREQYRRADDLAASARLARLFVLGKVANCRTVLSRSLRDHAAKVDADAIGLTVNQFARVAQQAAARRGPGQHPRSRRAGGQRLFRPVQSSDRGAEGGFRLCRPQPAAAADRVNCLLSFLYSLLYHDARSALETVGLDPAVGFLHRDRPGRMSLALDLMEEFRPVLADRLALSLINLGQVRKNGFKVTESGAVVMDDDARKTLLTEYQKRKQVEIEHPFLKEKMPFGMLLFAQAQLLSRYLRGDLEDYPPFIWR